MNQRTQSADGSSRDHSSVALAADRLGVPSSSDTMTENITKSREPVTLAGCVAVRCSGCISLHSRAARALGATEWELLQVLGTALNPTGSAAAKV